MSGKPDRPPKRPLNRRSQVEMRLPYYAHGNVVGGHYATVSAHDKDPIEINRQDFLSEHDVLVLPAGPLQVITEFLTRDTVELRIDEMIETPVRMQVGQER